MGNSINNEQDLWGGLKFDISELYNFGTYNINSNIIQKDFVYHGTIVSTGCHR